MTALSGPASPDVVGSSEMYHWLRPLRLAFLPGAGTPVELEVAAGLSRAFERNGHEVQAAPDDDTDVIFSFAPFGSALSWREAPFFQARRLYRLQRQPDIVTIIHARKQPWQELISHLEQAVAKEAPDPSDFAFPGLAPSAYHTLVEQGRRGGPVLAAERLLQAQAMCLRLLLVVGDDSPDFAHHFDLVGSLARTVGTSASFYDDIALRIVTAESADEIGAYTVVPPPIEREAWLRLSTPPAMHCASLELGHRSFFTETVHVGNLVHVPAMSGAIASQYSEGCFATWDHELNALVATITGSARPVDKGNVTDDELAIITAVREDLNGVYVRHVTGKRNDPPSSEAFEMIDIDNALPRISLTSAAQSVPVIRSKLHGHRGVVAYNPRRAEFVPMGEIYSRYPVTCGTRGQAEGIKAAFARSEALQTPNDPRQLVFTLLPTHGLFVVEKWAPDKAPFQLIWEAMDTGDLQITSAVPQGPETFVPAQVGHQ